MKKLIIFLLLCSLGFSQYNTPINFELLEERDGLYYEKFTDVPFTGEVTGKRQGSMRNGMKEGEWKFYYDDNALKAKGTYKQGKQTGETDTKSSSTSTQTDTDSDT